MGALLLQTARPDQTGSKKNVTKAPGAALPVVRVPEFGPSGCKTGRAFAYGFGRQKGLEKGRHGLRAPFSVARIRRRSGPKFFLIELNLLK